jgi:RHS repeat-associated protein
VTHKYGWGGEVQGGSPTASTDITYSYTGNRRNGFSYDAAGNLTNDLGQTFTYDVTGQQATASYGGYSLQQNYDGDGLRVKKSDNGTVTYYLRSTVLGGQVVEEMNSTGGWTRGYVYLGSQLMAVQQGGVFWMHEDPVTKSKRVTNSAGAVVSTIETDPWGADTNRSSNGAFQPKKFTSYERDSNGTDEAMFRRYNRWQSRFDQPDPYDGSYDYTDPQSFNRYAYVQGDPVNFVDPSGLVESGNGFCSAQYSFSDCGGWGGIYGGYFGSRFAEYQRTFEGIPEHARESYARYQTQRDLDAFMRWLPEGARYIGALSWAWTDYSKYNAPSHIYSFNEHRLSELIYWGGQFAFHYGNGIYRDVYGHIIGEDGIDMHPAVDPVWFAAGITEGLLRGGAKAGAETAIENSVAKQLTFQTEHIMRHFVGTGLTEAEVIGGLRQSIQAALRGAASEGGFWGRVSIRGQLIEYRAYTLANGTVRIGTAYPWPRP